MQVSLPFYRYTPPTLLRDLSCKTLVVRETLRIPLPLIALVCRQSPKASRFTRSSSWHPDSHGCPLTRGRFLAMHPLKTVVAQDVGCCATWSGLSTNASMRQTWPALHDTTVTGRVRKLLKPMVLVDQSQHTKQFQQRGGHQCSL